MTIIHNRLSQYKDGIFYPKRTIVESTEKTIEQWFIDTLQQDDAAQAISETRRLSGARRLQQLEESFDHALYSAFDWSKSRLGYLYWESIHCHQGR